MKIQNKKMIAFLMAIVMIVTFANFGTLSAFANDEEPIENTETTLEDNTEGNSEEQQVEELVSEIPELVSEPGSPDDPTENGTLGDISSGEIDFSQGGDTADLNGLDQPSTYEPIGSSYQYLPDGVYSLKNYGNTNYWASILNASDDANGYAVQTYYTDNPMDSFNRACLFKISRIPNTNRYVIRLMLNNRLGLSLVGSAVRTKELPTNDADVPASDTFVIVPNGSGYTIKPYNSDYVITVPDSTSSGTSNAKLHRNTAAKAGDRCIWTFYRYTGEPLLGIPLDFSPNDWSYGATLNTEYTVELKPWSTTIGANTPYVTLHPDSVGAATEERIDAYTIKITPTKVGPITIRAQIYVDGTTTTHTSYRCDFITVPDFDGETAFIENGQTKQHIEVTGSSTSSGAVIQQRSFHGANNSRWTFELEWWGYFSIKSVHSNLRMGVDPSNTSVIKQTSEQTTYTDWMFTETPSGYYTIKNKAVSDKVLSVPTGGGDGADLTLVTYSDNEDRNDLFVINIIEVFNYVELEGQATSSYCWVASARMFAKNYATDVSYTQDQVARYIKGAQYDEIDEANNGGDYMDAANAILYYLSNSTHNVENIDIVYIYTENIMKRFLDDGHVIYIQVGWFEDLNNIPEEIPGHAFLITGYVLVNGDCRFIVEDPWPVNAGEMYTVSYEKLVNGRNSQFNETDDINIWLCSIVAHTEYSGQFINNYFGE